MNRTFRYPLKPNKAQEKALEGYLLACQRLYNGALEERREAYRRQNRTLTKYDQYGKLTDLRAEDPFFGGVPARILRSALDRLDLAYKAFFRRVKRGDKPGFPRFRARDRYDSFSFPLPVVQNNRIKIPSLGYVKLNLYRELRGEPKTATVQRTAKGWEVTIVCDVGPAPGVKIDTSKSTGIDLGLTHFFTLSDGSKIDNPRFFKRGEDTLARRQRSLATKKRGSHSRKRAKALVGRAHLHIRNQRLDFVRKIAKSLVSQYDVIAHEELNVKGLIEKKEGLKLSKSISDAGWRLFLHCLASKAEEAGKLVMGVDPRGTSQRCSGCGKVLPKTLRDRWHECDCGVSLDRDHNASLNIQALGLSVVRERVTSLGRTPGPFIGL